MIACILAIFIIIVWEALPMVFPAEWKPVSSISFARKCFGSVGMDEYQEWVYAVEESGQVTAVSVKEPSRQRRFVLREGESGKRLKAAAPFTRLGEGGVVTEAGVLVPFKMEFSVTYPGEGVRVVSPTLRRHDPIALEAGDRRRKVAAMDVRYPTEGNISAAVAVEGSGVWVNRSKTEENLMGEVERASVSHRLAVPPGAGRVTALAWVGDGEALVAGTDQGALAAWAFSADESPPILISTWTVVPEGGTNAAVTRMAFLLGSQSLVVGDAAGRVTVWARLGDPHVRGGIRWIHPRAFEGHAGPVTAIGPSPRDKQFVTGDQTGGLILHHLTSHRTLAKRSEGAPVLAVAIAPKLDAVVTRVPGAVRRWALHSPHPEVSWSAMFEKTWYEGYDRPAHVWQSTGGTDDFESKFGLVPLLLGTAKGTLYAMLFAVPVAVLAALYTALFMKPSIRQWLKPTVEVMAALPSVVIGFLAGLWLAPRLEKVVVGVLMLAVTLPLSSIAAYLVHRAISKWKGWRFETGGELWWIVPAGCLAAWMTFATAPGLEQWWFGGNFQAWLLRAWGLNYDQRNSLVVGIAMGFAVIPIIFTISEDALSSVPRHLTSGSLALGASRWQTAMRVVLPTASPGIFSAAMIGFGRAVGETMIVLMATGNTPVLDWNIFNGMRTLSANIAVEIPEAPYHSSLYRLLFFSALLLFISTFIVNTVAELARQHLREKYRYL